MLVDRFVHVLVRQQLCQGISSIPKWDCQGNDLRMGIPLLQNMLVQIAEEMPRDYVDGARTLYVIYPPTLEVEVSQTLASLLWAPSSDPKGRRLIRIQKDGLAHVFEVEPCRLDFPELSTENPRWLLILLSNPDTPLLAIRIPQDPWIHLVDRLSLGNTRELGDSVRRLLTDYLCNNQVAVKFIPEPNGPATFPDFQAEINGVVWTIEVTRVMSGIAEGRTFQTGSRDPERIIDKMARSSPVDQEVIDHALTTALADKSAKFSGSQSGSKYCLVLVDVAHLGLGNAAPIWNDKNLSAFDAVILVSEANPRPVIEFIKGNLVHEARTDIE